MTAHAAAEAERYNRIPVPQLRSGAGVDSQQRSYDISELNGPGPGNLGPTKTHWREPTA
jgi:hypothetical protein